MNLINWKTTLAGAIPAIAILLKTFGVIDLSPDQVTAVLTIAVLVAGFFAKDNNVTGGTKENK